MASSFPPSRSELIARASSQFADRFAYLFVDADLLCHTPSPNLARLLQLDADHQIAGEPVTAVIEELWGTEAALQEVLNGRQPYFHLQDINKVDRHGNTVYLNLHLSPYAPEAPQRGLLLTVEDCSRESHLRQRLTQERNNVRLAKESLAQINRTLDQLNHTKSLFLSMAAHDLRTPLTAIIGYAGMLQEDLQEMDAEGEGVDVAERILSQARWLNRLIEDLLDLDRIERGELHVQLEPLSLTQLVEQLVTTLAPAYQLQEIHLSYATPEAEVWIHGDAARLRQVLYNLVGNSAKYVPQDGSAQIKIDLKTDGKRATELTVIDNGSGIPQEKLPHLFDLYYRVSSEQRISGSGLGLYIVHQIVEAHAAQIAVESKLQQGTRFVIRFPLTQG